MEGLGFVFKGQGKTMSKDIHLEDNRGGDYIATRSLGVGKYTFTGRAVQSNALLERLRSAAESRREMLLDVRDKTMNNMDRYNLVLRAQALDDLESVCRAAMESANVPDEARRSRSLQPVVGGKD
jgi:hypothetical protein